MFWFLLNAIFYLQGCKLDSSSFNFSKIESSKIFCRSVNKSRFDLVSDMGDFSNQPEDSYVTSPEVFFDITVGGGVIVADFDNDGLLDIYLPTNGEDLIYINKGARQFELKQDWLTGLSALDKSVGGSAADFDGDGDFDLYLVTAFGPDRLLMNTGTRLEDVSEAYGINRDDSDNTAASWYDYDLDGDLDLFVAGHKDDDYDPDSECPPAYPNRLYQNLGSRFVEIEIYPEDIEAYTYASTWIQTEEGAPPCLYNINDFGYEKIPNRLYQITEGQHQPIYSTGLDIAMNGMGVAINDLNEDGWPDVLMSDFEKVHLYLSDSNSTWYDGTYASSVLVNSSFHRFSWGVNIFDMENDGLLDLYAGWGPISNHGDGMSEDDSLKQPNSFWRNTGEGFNDMAEIWGVDNDHISRGSVVADIDMDGIQDVVLRHLDAPAEILWGQCMNGDWLSLELNHSSMNKYGVGSKVTVYTVQREHTQWVIAGDSFASGGAPRLHFGFGETTEQELRIEVVLPSGQRFEHWLPVNQHSIVSL